MTELIEHHKNLWFNKRGNRNNEIVKNDMRSLDNLALDELTVDMQTVKNRKVTGIVGINFEEIK